MHGGRRAPALLELTAHLTRIAASLPPCCAMSSVHPSSARDAPPPGSSTRPRAQRGRSPEFSRIRPSTRDVVAPSYSRPGASSGCCKRNRHEYCRKVASVMGSRMSRTNRSSSISWRCSCRRTEAERRGAGARCSVQGKRGRTTCKGLQRGGRRFLISASAAVSISFSSRVLALAARSFARWIFPTLSLRAFRSTGRLATAS